MRKTRASLAVFMRGGLFRTWIDNPGLLASDGLISPNCNVATLGVNKSSFDRTLSETLPLMRQWSLLDVSVALKTEQCVRLRTPPRHLAISENVSHQPDRLSPARSSTEFIAT